MVGEGYFRYLVFMLALLAAPFAHADTPKNYLETIMQELENVDDPNKNPEAYKLENKKNKRGSAPTISPKAETAEQPKQKPVAQKQAPKPSAPVAKTKPKPVPVKPAVAKTKPAAKPAKPAVAKKKPAPKPTATTQNVAQKAAPAKKTATQKDKPRQQAVAKPVATVAKKSPAKATSPVAKPAETQAAQAAVATPVEAAPAPPTAEPVQLARSESSARDRRRGVTDIAQLPQFDIQGGEVEAIEQFQDSMRISYPGSYFLMRRLPDEEKGVIYNEYKETGDIVRVRRLILEFVRSHW